MCLNDMLQAFVNILVFLSDLKYISIKNGGAVWVQAIKISILIEQRLNNKIIRAQQS